MTVTHEVFLRLALSRHVQSLEGSGQCVLAAPLLSLECLGDNRSGVWGDTQSVPVWISLLLCPTTLAAGVPCVQMAAPRQEGTLVSALDAQVAVSRRVTVLPGLECVAGH